MSPGMHPSEQPEVYRRRRFVVPHRRRRLAVRLLRPLLTALLLVGVPSSLAAWVATSPRFQVTTIGVAGTERVAAEWVSEALRGLKGQHLLWVRLDDVRRRLRAHPWIRDIAVRKQIPDQLHVAIEERLPVALLRLRGELYFVERDATRIAPFDPALGPSDLLVLEAPTGATIEVEPALDLAAEWRRLDPIWSGDLIEIEIVSDDDFRVRTADLPFPVLVSPRTLAAGVERLTWLLPEIRRRYREVAVVDLRFMRQIVIQPAALPQIEEG